MTTHQESLRELLGIELPIIQAPMAGVQGSALAVAVSNAGGLGSLPCAMLTVDAMRKELATISCTNIKTFQCELLLPRAALGRHRARSGLENDTCPLLRGVWHGREQH